MDRSLSPTEDPPAWLTDGAFVLRFAAATDPKTGVVVGRVEDVVSGRGIRFESYDEMLAFVRGVLADGRAR